MFVILPQDSSGQENIDNADLGLRIAEFFPYSAFVNSFALESSNPYLF